MNQVHGYTPAHTPSITNRSILLGLLFPGALFCLLAAIQPAVDWRLMFSAALIAVGSSLAGSSLTALIAVGSSLAGSSLTALIAVGSSLAGSSLTALISAGSSLAGSSLAALISAWSSLAGSSLLYLVVACPLYNRITPEEALQHQVRRRLMEQVLLQPGISTSQLMELIDVNRSTLLYHLNYMCRQNLLRMVSTPAGYRQVYPADYSDDQIPKNSTPKAERILRLIHQYPGSTQGELAVLTRVTKQAVAPHLSRLLLDERIIWERQGRARHYFPNGS